MSWFYNLKVGTKLILSFIFVAFIAGIVGYEGIVSLKNADNSDTILFEKNTLPIEAVGQISEAFQRQRVNLLEAITIKDKNRKKDEIQIIEEMNKQISSNLKTYKNAIISEEAKDSFTKLEKDLNSFNSSLDKIVELVKDGKSDEALSLYLNELDTPRKLVHEDLDNMAAMKAANAKQRSDNNTLEANAAVKLMLILAIAGVLIAILLGYFISKLISKPLQIISDAAQKVAAGDIEVEMKQTSNDEVGKLMGVIGDVMIRSIKDQVAVAEKIAEGDYNVEIKVKSEKDVLGISLNKIVQTIKNLVTETNSLSKAAVEGKLAARGNVEGFQRRLQGNCTGRKQYT